MGRSRGLGLARRVGVPYPASSGGGPFVSATQRRGGWLCQAHHRSGDARSCSGCRVGCGEASGGAGTVQLYPVNSGPNTRFNNESARSRWQLKLNTRQSRVSVSYAGDESLAGQSLRLIVQSGRVRALVTVPAGGGFTIKTNDSSIMVKIWSFSGDGTCPDQAATSLPLERRLRSGRPAGAVSFRRRAI